MKTDTKTDTRTIVTESGPRVAAVPTSAVPSGTPSTPPPPASDLEAELLAIAQEEESLQQRKTQRRQQFWDVTIAGLTRSIEQLRSYGFERVAIAKALGFVGSGKPLTSPKKGTGPNTHEGWFAFFTGTGVRSYLKAHPGLAATLKSSNVAPADQGSHLPADAFKAIQETARQKAESKCPRSTPVEVSK